MKISTTVGRMFPVLVILVLVTAISGNATAGTIGAIWAVNDGERIERDDLASPYKATNSAWDGDTIHLYGARNEVVAFQVIVQSGADGLDAVSVALPGLAARSGGARIVYRAPAADPTDYRDRPIQLFSEHYMNVERASSAGWFYPSDISKPAAPDDPTGLKPVQLVPENARPGLGGFPVTVPPNMNQGFWIDIYIPKDLASGMYLGTVDVRGDGDVRRLPVELEVFDFTLPDENTIDLMVYFEEGQTGLYHGVENTESLNAAYHRFAHRQRAEFVHAYNEQTAAAAMGRFSGGDFTRANGYAGPGEGVGNVLVPRTFYGPGQDFAEEAAARRNADSWMTWLNRNLPGKTTFLYLPDEPREDKYEEIHRYARFIHDDPGPGKDLPLLVTAGYREGVDGGIQAIDIWCSYYGHYDIQRAIVERGHGDDMWIYNGQRPFGGAPLLDTPATDLRSNIWACFKHDIPVYFLWHCDHWRHNGQIPDDLERNQNVWADPVSYKNKGGSWANGDGCLIYPGREVIHSAEDRGIDGPCSSMRMANLRRGAQDHCYLTLARERGFDTAVNEALERIVPRVLSDVKSSEEVQFPEHGDEYEFVRILLGRMLGGTE